ncbi:LysR family transcriptional regulator [Streptomyces sp. QL37]|uniref:LysR family transcriptional regulator n=1 Tax=Streptomyces sp. QL37 TaxID=2093747 RepID=UPI000CF2C6BD|nr:LysR family transcriptional regulator [Streptomyces sp. QL37]PPQ56431.1 LysR family transcriptional regulator [Streptomyces sp. QL37]
MTLTDLRRLRLLRELAERGTLAAVAAATDYSPSAVSQQLTVLEREAGSRLIEPAGRGVRLTEAGMVLARHAGVLLDAAAAAEAELAGLSGEVRGRIRAVGLQSAARRLLIPALVELASARPLVEVEITELELELALPELRLGTVDLLISDEYDGYPRPRPDGLHHQLLLREGTRLVLPAQHPLAAGPGPVSLSALRDAVWASSSAGTGHHAMVVGTCRAHGGFDPDLRHQSDDADVQLELVRTAGAVTLLPDLTLPTGDRLLAIRDIAETGLSRRLYVVTREQSSTTPALSAYIQALLGQGAEHCHPS